MVFRYFAVSVSVFSVIARDVVGFKDFCSILCPNKHTYRCQIRKYQEIFVIVAILVILVILVIHET